MPIVLTTSAPSREAYEQILAIVGEDAPQAASCTPRPRSMEACA